VAKVTDRLVLKYLRLFAEQIEGRVTSIRLLGASQSFSPDNEDMAALMDHLENSVRKAICEVIVESADQRSSFQFRRGTSGGSDSTTASAPYDEIEIHGDGFSKVGQLTQLYAVLNFLSEIFSSGDLPSRDEEGQEIQAQEVEGQEALQDGNTSASA
jgi:hypothetical protein